MSEISTKTKSGDVEKAKKLAVELSQVLETLSEAKFAVKTKRLVELLHQTLDEISALCDKDPDGKKYPGLWALHADICQTFDEMGE